MNQDAESTIPEQVNPPQTATGHSRRLIEEWLPIAAIGEESVRERRSMTALPPTYYLHVWWARRPLVASRAAILASLLPAGADRGQFMHVLGIHGDPVLTRKRIDEAKRSGERFKGAAYDYRRAFSYVPTDPELRWVRTQLGSHVLTVLDPTAGGGSIPFEAMRLGCEVVANDLNPVSWLLLKATVDFPARFGHGLHRRYQELAAEFVRRRDEQLAPFFPDEPQENCYATNWIWARTLTCPYCGGKIPLSPNWRLNSKGVGVRLVPVTEDAANRHIRFEIVHKLSEHSQGTVSSGKGSCPFGDCGRIIDGDEIKSQAQAGKMGEQLYAVVYKEHKITGYTKPGTPKIKAVRAFRAPRPGDDVGAIVRRALDDNMPRWEARGIVPDEVLRPGNKTNEPIRYGMGRWRDLFSPRQLLGHVTAVEVFHDLAAECGAPADVSDLDGAALTYVCLAIDKILNYNSRMSIWMPTREVVANTFNRHDFAFCWSHAEMAPTIRGLGYDWTIEQTGKALKELIQLVGHEPLPRRTKGDQEQLELHRADAEARDVPLTITSGSGDALVGVEDASVDAVIIDPPYYDNVMYAELADFFYVWLKRTAGLLFPEPFSDHLTDKDREAVANPAKFKDFAAVKGTGGANRRAHRDYQERMQAIFTECRRVLKADGIMTLMFTHKASGAWDALAKGLVEAGFIITASWPVNTEAEGSLHIKDKNAAKSTIFLVCRPRADMGANGETTYWEEVEPKVTQVVREHVAEFQEAGIGGVDLYLSCFGPALEVFSEHWPMIRGRPAQKPTPARGAQLKLIEEEEWDPYAVRPEDALMAARAAVKDWRLEQITTVKRQTHLDPVTEFFVLAWDAFMSPQFPADEALKLARVVGVSFDQKLRGQILEVKGGDVILWDSSLRVQKGTLSATSKDVKLDILHQAARTCREQNTGAARTMIERAEVLKDPQFLHSLEAVLNVLPTPTMALGRGPIQGAAEDAAVLEKLRQLVFAHDIPRPKPWMLFDTEE